MWRSLFNSLTRTTACLHTSALVNMELQALVQVLERIAPLQAAEPWDNVGLLVEPTGKCIVNTVLITNDLTEQVLDEVLANPGAGAGGRVGLIVAYHPPIFKPYKKLTQHSAKERIVVRAVEERIGIYSPHTSLDNMEGGINDWLLSAVGEGEITALGVRKLPPPFPNILHLGGSENWEQMKESVLHQQGVGGVQVSQSGVTVECKDTALGTLLPTLRRNFPSLSTSISPNTKIEPILSGGKLLTLAHPTPLSEVLRRVKAKLKLEHVRLARPCGGEDPLVATAAACAGSGGGVLEGGQADLLLTGEMSHHQVLDAVSRGSAVILCEHSNTERGYLQGQYRELVEQAVQGAVSVTVPKTDKDPLEIL